MSHEVVLDEKSDQNLVVLSVSRCSFLSCNMNMNILVYYKLCGDFK